MTGVLLLIVTVLLSARLFVFVDEYAVNMPYWDQWDFLRPFFQEADLLTRVLVQHGPHRQGLGALLLSVLYPLTQWDLRAECFVAAATLLVACGVYFGVKYRLNPRWSLTDLAIPLLVLSILQCELFVGAPNPSHGSLPALLIALVALCLTMDNPMPRSLLLAALSVVSTYTGFAFFNGLILTSWLVLDWWTHRNSGGPNKLSMSLGLAATVAIAGIGSYFIDYKRQPAIDCFVFPHPKPEEYGEFVALMVGRAFGSSTFGLIAGESPEKWFLIALESLGVCWAWAWSFWRICRGTRGRESFVTLYLASFSLLFAGMAAIGRVCGGMVFAMSSRYVPYMIPGILALYLAMSTALPPGRLRSLLLTGFIVLLVLKEARFDSHDDEFKRLRDGKKSWAQCYLARKDVHACNEATGFVIHPSADPAFLKSKLDYLESNKLNFFAQPNRL
jgi:hypothetical protein